MKNSIRTLKTLISAAALAFPCLAFAENSEAEKENATESVPAAVETILNRTSIRVYADKDVEKAKETLLLKAAMAAPTAGNKRPWAFVVVRDKEIRKQIAAKLRSAGMVANAPLAVVICGDMNKRFPGDAADFWVQDVSAATENLLLAAHALDLGAVWCGVHPVPQRVKDISAILGLPENIVPLSVVAVGYPKAPQAPKDKWDESLVHQDKW